MVSNQHWIETANDLAAHAHRTHHLHAITRTKPSLYATGTARWQRSKYCEPPIIHVCSASYEGHCEYSPSNSICH